MMWTQENNSNIAAVILPSNFLKVKKSPMKIPQQQILRKKRLKSDPKVSRQLIFIISIQHFSAECAAGYTCYTKECSSENGPDELLQGLESTPNTPIFAATRALYNKLLQELKCPNVKVEMEEQYCCNDMIAKIKQSKLFCKY